MNRQIEIEISQLLQTFDTKTVVEKLSQRLVHSELPLERSHEVSIMNFILESGYYEFLFPIFIHKLANKEPISWAAFIEVMSRNNIKPTKEVLNSLFSEALHHHMLENIITSHGWDDLDSRFEILRQELRTQMKKEIEHRKETLKEKLGFLCNQRMMEEEEKLLQTLLTMFPNDADILAHQTDFQDRWARNVLTSSYQGRFSSEVHSSSLFFQRSEKEENLLSLWVEEAKTICSRRPELAYMFTIFFVFLEGWKHALTILELVPDSKKKDWLRINILIYCRQFVTCLTELEEIESKYTDDPETSFSVAYFKAQSLYGLGQQSLALELLQNILNLRPNYRSAQALLKDWLGGNHQ